MTDTFDELLIIAKDTIGMSIEDRAILVRAADELQTAYLMILTTQASLIESQARQIALNDRVIELMKPSPPLSAPVGLQVYDGPLSGKWSFP